MPPITSILISQLPSLIIGGAAQVPPPPAPDSSPSPALPLAPMEPGVVPLPPAPISPLAIVGPTPLHINTDIENLARDLGLTYNERENYYVKRDGSAGIYHRQIDGSFYVIG